MIRSRLKTLIVAGALTALAGAAQAETSSLESAVFRDGAAPVQSKIAWGAKPAVNLSLAAPYAQRDGVTEPDGMPKTAIDHRFASGVGSIGYLCGLQPGPNERGGPASTFDPEGTFLGGQLKLALK